MPVTTGWNRLVLVYNTTTVGTYLHGFVSSVSRATAINVRHNFWDITALLDGSYPAQVWEHNFVLYHEAANLKQFADDFLGLSDLFYGTATGLRISLASSPSGTYMSFGSCLLQDKPVLQKPDLLFQQQAGFFGLSFLGTTKPS